MFNFYKKFNHLFKASKIIGSKKYNLLKAIKFVFLMIKFFFSLISQSNKVVIM